MTLFRVHYMTADTIPHVYCRVFVSALPGMTYAAVGNLTMLKDEFADFRKLLNAEYIEEQRT